MNKYICWVNDRREETEKEIEAENSFKARQELAAQWGVAVTDCVSIATRFLKATTPNRGG